MPSKRENNLISIAAMPKIVAEPKTIIASAMGVGSALIDWPGDKGRSRSKAWEITIPSPPRQIATVASPMAHAEPVNLQFDICSVCGGEPPKLKPQRLQ